MTKIDLVLAIIDYLLEDSKQDPLCLLMTRNTLQLRLQKLTNNKLKAILETFSS